MLQNVSGDGTQQQVPAGPAPVPGPGPHSYPAVPGFMWGCRAKEKRNNSLIVNV